jgi:hypothetical protein
MLMSVACTAMQISAASASNHDDVRRQRERVRQRRAAAAAQVDVLRAQDVEVEAALDALTADVAAQEALLGDANRAVAQAEQQLATARLSEKRMLARIADLKARITAMAVRAYTGTSRPDPTDSILHARDLNEAARRSALVEMMFGNVRDVRDQLEAAREDLALARQAAEAAAKTATLRRTEVAQRLAQVSAARDRQVAFARELDVRIEARLSEAAGLAHLDLQLGAEIVRRQEALARRNLVSRGAGGGSVRPIGPVPLRSVRGIWVHQSIADQLDRLLGAADADGISLSGGGYRDPSEQQRLREANCADPLNSPASECTPPTARPGQSMHERGLAVDFTYQGRIISSRSSPAYQWLDRNAGRFGFANLPSEPWHWSTNGQ